MEVVCYAGLKQKLIKIKSCFNNTKTNKKIIRVVSYNLPDRTKHNECRDTVNDNNKRQRFDITRFFLEFSSTHFLLMIYADRLLSLFYSACTSTSINVETIPSGCKGA